jgi:hypothetical protein
MRTSGSRLSPELRKTQAVFDGDKIATLIQHMIRLAPMTASSDTEMRDKPAPLIARKSIFPARRRKIPCSPCENSAATSEKPPQSATRTENFPASREFQGLGRSAMPQRYGCDNNAAFRVSPRVP